MKSRVVLPLFGGIALVAAMATNPFGVTARAAGPITVAANGPSQSYSGNFATPVEPDQAGPPAPTCAPNDAAGCDQTSVTFTTTGFDPSQYTFGLSVYPTFTPAAAGQCLDLTIEDSSSNVLTSATCVGSGATSAITASKVKAGTYTVEVDLDSSSGEPTAAQSWQITVLGLAVPISTGNGSGGSTGGPPAATFSHEVTVDPQHAQGEPDVAITSDGSSMYAAGPWGFSTTISNSWNGVNGGTQWRQLHGGCAADQLKADCSRGGGDAEIQLSQPGAAGEPQTVQYTDLNGLDTISCAYSTNGGDTFTDVTTGSNPLPGTACNEAGTVPASCQAANPAGCPTDSNPNLPGTDRPWLQVWPVADQPAGATSDKLYQIFDTGETPGGDAAIYSSDNGKTWSLGCQTTGTSCLGGANGMGSRPGPLVINPTLLQTVGGVTYPTLYEFMGTNSNGTEVNISCDGGQTWSNVVTSVADGGSTTTDFVVGAIDTAGNVYTAYAVQNGTSPWVTFYSHTTGSGIPTGSNCSQPVPGGADPTSGKVGDVGANWVAPIPLSGPKDSVSNGANIQDAVMPWIAAGDPGRLDVVYYGTDAQGINPASASALWNLHFAQSTDALDATPAFTDVVAADTPMHNNSICFNGIGCSLTVPNGDRNLSDFFQVVTDSSGRAIIIYTDDNNSAQDPVANPGAAVTSMVEQASGASLYAATGSVPPLSPKFLGQSTDIRTDASAGGCASIAATVCAPSGDAQLATVGHNIAGQQVPAADITKLQVISKDASTVEFLFTVANLSAGPSCTSATTVNGSCGVVNTNAGGTYVPHTGAQWLVTWHWNNDLWYAQATSDAAGNAAFSAGRPLSVYNDGEPKALEYTSAGNTEATAVTGAFDLTNNTVEIDVPLSAIGGVGTGSDTGTNHTLYGVTGWTGDSTSSSVESVTGTGANGNVLFFDNIDQTAPLDVLVASPAVSTPEAPLALLMVLAGLGVVAVLAVRRRRRGAIPA